MLPQLSMEQIVIVGLVLAVVVLAAGLLLVWRRLSALKHTPSTSSRVQVA
jgi:ABC-type Mn2+/Zn2+ transport system permease subunit